MTNSFFAKCFASGRTIRTGDRCYLFPVVRNHSKETVELETRALNWMRLHGAATSADTPDCYWKPLGYFLTGTYVADGKVSIGHSDSNAVSLFDFVQHLYQNGPRTKQGEGYFDFERFIDERAPRVGTLITKNTTTVSSCLKHSHFEDVLHVFNQGHRISLENSLFLPDDGQELAPALFAYMSEASFEYLVGMVVKKAAVLARTSKSKDKRKTAPAVDLRSISDSKERHRQFLALMLDEAAHTKDRYQTKQAVLEAELGSCAKDGMSASDICSCPEMAFRYAMVGLRYLGIAISPLTLTPHDHASDYAEFMGKMHTGA